MLRTRNTWVVSIGVSLLLCPSVTLAQVSAQVTLIPDAPSCERCTITVRALHELGTSDGPAGLAGLPGIVQVDGQGRYWVVQNEHVPLVFDSTGKFLRALGTRGQGPGEFERVRAVVPLGADTTLVLDPGNGRASILDRELKTVSTMAFRWQVGPGLWRSGREILATSILRAPESAGWPLHIISFDGREARVLRSFGPGPRKYDENDSGALFALRWNLAEAAGGGVWTGERDRYRITRWSADGSILQQLERRPEWFAVPSHLELLGGLRKPPTPRMADGIAESTDGLLWTFTLVPGADWQSAWPPPPSATGGRSGPGENPARDRIREVVSNDRGSPGSADGAGCREE